MRVLLTQDNKAIRIGQFVTASEDAKEFILDTKSDDLPTVPSLYDIVDANGLEVAKNLTKPVLIEQLEKGITDMGLDEQNEMTQEQKVDEIVAAGNEHDQSDDEMLILIVQSGIGFKAAGRLFKSAMEKGGYRVSASNRKDAVLDILNKAEFAPENRDELTDMIEHIVKEVNDTNSGQALKIIKAYAKDLELELPKVPKIPKGGLAQRFDDWFVSNIGATDENIQEWFKEQGKDAKATQTYMFRWHRAINLARAIASKAIETEKVPANVTPRPVDPAIKDKEEA